MTFEWVIGLILHVTEALSKTFLIPIKSTDTPLVCWCHHTWILLCIATITDSFFSCRSTQTQSRFSASSPVIQPCCQRGRHSSSFGNGTSFHSILETCWIVHSSRHFSRCTRFLFQLPQFESPSIDSVTLLSALQDYFILKKDGKSEALDRTPWN